MMKRGSTLIISVLAICASVAAAREMAGDGDWPQWRGPSNTGVAVTDAPTDWSDTKNVKWKTAIPGLGHSSPVLWGSRVFVTTAIPSAGAPAEPAAAPSGRGAGGGAGPLVPHNFDVLAIDRESGKVLWQKTATVATPHEGYHRQYGSFASNSPVTDGTHVFASFGSRGVFAYDLNGNLAWKKDFGIQMRMKLQFGEGTAPLLHADRLILNFDQETGDSFIVALDKKTGKELWRTPRPEISNWSMPMVVEHGGRKQIVVSATTKVRSYDFETGKLIWDAAGLGLNTIPTPVQFGDTVLVMSGYRNPKLMSIKLGREGDLTGTDAIAWTADRGLAYSASPVLHDGRLYVLTDNGMLSCFDAKTGTPSYQERLPGPSNFKSSPVAAGGKLYLSSEEGNVIVVKLGPAFEVVTINKMADQVFIATPAVAGGDIFLRSKTTLFRISDK